jgi:acyl carrier protein
MDQNEALNKVVTILAPFSKNKEALASVGLDTSLMKDLKINSARLVDVVLELEEAFGIQVSDEEADKIQTVRDVVGMILSKT